MGKSAPGSESQFPYQEGTGGQGSPLPHGASEPGLRSPPSWGHATRLRHRPLTPDVTQFSSSKEGSLLCRTRLPRPAKEASLPRCSPPESRICYLATVIPTQGSVSRPGSSANMAHTLTCTAAAEGRDLRLGGDLRLPGRNQDARGKRRGAKSPGRRVNRAGPQPPTRCQAAACAS